MVPNAPQLSLDVHPPAAPHHIACTSCSPNRSPVLCVPVLHRDIARQHTLHVTPQLLHMVSLRLTLLVCHSCRHVQQRNAIIRTHTHSSPKRTDVPPHERPVLDRVKSSADVAVRHPWPSRGSTAHDGSQHKAAQFIRIRFFVRASPQVHRCNDCL